MKAFAGKTALITGGASGIGRALAVQLLCAGARVRVADISGAARTARELGCEGVALDVTCGAAVTRVVRDFARAHGRIDYLFNNAGVVVVGEARAMADDDWTRVIDVNLNGVVYGVRAAYPIMIRQGRGHIVNTASAAGLVPVPGGVAYSTSKHGIVGLSTSLRAEARRYGVRVSVLCPGFVRTPMADTGKMLGGIDRATALSVIDRLGWMRPEDLARIALQAIARNRAVIVAPLSARLLVDAVRRFPAAGEAFTRVAAGLICRLMEGRARGRPMDCGRVFPAPSMPSSCGSR